MGLAKASEFIGLPYCLGGRERPGVDCAGLVLLYLREVHSIMLPPDDGRPTEPGWEHDAESRFLAYLNRYGRREDEPRDGDIVLVHLVRQTAHVGVMVDGQNMLHTSRDRTAEISRVCLFGHRVLGFWRVVRQ